MINLQPIPYDDFLRAKVAAFGEAGIAIETDSLHPILKGHQREGVAWCLRKGRAALFASFGMGKTVMQLEIARQLLLVGEVERALIVLPLGVRQEFVRDARLLDVEVTFVRTSAEVTGPGIYLTNYESVREGKLDVGLFGSVSLDEAAILRGFGGSKTFRELMRQFEGARFRFVATATPSPNEYIELLAYSAFLGVMDIGQAKAQPLDAKVLTPSGWQPMGSIQPGDQVIAADGSSTRVLGTYPQGERPIFRVTFSDGGSTECTGDHLWLTRTQYERNNERRYTMRNGPQADRCGSFGTVRTLDEIAGSMTAQGGANHSIPVVGPVKFNRQEPLPINPWLLGALLGDGCLRETSIVFSTADGWMRDHFASLLPDGLWLRETGVGSQDFSVTSTGKKGGNGPGSNHLLNELRCLDLLGKRSYEKKIPDAYLTASVADRTSLLQGLMDTDGTIASDGQTMLSTTSSVMADQVSFIVRSLGGIASIRPAAPCEATRNQAFLVEIRMTANPFSLPRKAARHRADRVRANSRFITKVEPVGFKPAQCIAVEHPDRLYVTDDFVVTHNTRFFKRDSTNADRLTLHPHKEAEFWYWMSTWGLFLTRPSDLGYSDEGYDLPALDVRWHELPSDHSQAGADRDGQNRMFRNAAIGVVDSASEKRSSLTARVAKMLDLRAEQPDEHRLIWHDLEDERRAIEAAIPGITTVYGSQSLDDRETAIIGFSDGDMAEMAGKPSIAGVGCNFQRHCARAIFLGIGHKFHDFLQSIHRIARFGQTRQVRIDLIYTEAEREIRRSLEAKWRRHDEQMERMRTIVREYGLAGRSTPEALTRAMGVARREEAGAGWRMVHNDSVREAAAMPDASVGLIVTSIPFSTQYEYSPNYADLGHSDDNDHFWSQMDYLTVNLLRVLQPGRDMVVHVKDRITPGGVNGLGFQTLHPFHAEAIYHYQSHGFAFLGMKTVTTDVVRENNQTYRLGWSEQCKDGSRMGCGVPEYLLMFRRPPTDLSVGYADAPIVKEKPLCADHGEPAPFDKKTNWRRPVPGTGYSRGRWQFDAHGYSRSSGDRLLSRDELASMPHEALYKWWRGYSTDKVYDFREHLAVSEMLDEMERLPATFMLMPPHSPHPDVLTDVARMRTLNMVQAQKGREAHVCPLQLDLVERCILQLSMPGDVVLDPFAGIGTVPYLALKLGRIGLGIELSPDYWRDAIHYCRAEEDRQAVPSLFDLLDAAGQVSIDVHAVVEQIAEAAD